MMDRPSRSLSDDPGTASLFDRAEAVLKDDPETAKKLLREAANKGCTASMVLLGDVLIDGNDEEKAEALDLFKKAYENGNNMGSRNIGYCYAIGLGVAADKEKAAKWYTISANAGNARATLSSTTHQLLTTTTFLGPWLICEHQLCLVHGHF